MLEKEKVCNELLDISKKMDVKDIQRITDIATGLLIAQQATEVNKKNEKKVIGHAR